LQYRLLFLPVEVFVDVAQALVGQVGVDLRRGDGRVAEKFLNGTNIRAVGQ